MVSLIRTIKVVFAKTWLEIYTLSLKTVLIMEKVGFSQRSVVQFYNKINNPHFYNYYVNMHCIFQGQKS